eukprot:GHVQ01000908.1.p1 GENE.GHVQ01000908.1~~GHVQ01000908.1.p1  ORF type:complete len:306 (+),score=12.82 GHVQ01000908.1:1010-1927(+)
MKKLSARYLRLCSRSKRQVAIVNVKVIDAMLSTLPSAVDDELRIQGHAESIESIIKHAPIIEAEFNRRRKYSPSWSAAICPNVPAATSGTRNWIPTSPCHGWGDQGHWRKDCPYREYRCDKCHVIGHIAKACRNFIVKDSLGRVRQRVIPKERKLQTETAVDSSTAQAGVSSETSRLANLHDSRVRRYLSYHLSPADQLECSADTVSLKVGDFVLFPRSPPEIHSQDTVALSEKYQARWSLPAKILEVKDKQLQVVEYVTGRVRKVPVTQWRKLPVDIPQPLRQLNWQHILHHLPRRWVVVYRNV